MKGQRGFTYLGLMILLTIIGLVGAASLKVGSLLQRAAAEEELLEIGAQFSAALKSYADATPRGQPPQPKTLQDLLRDPRYPGVRRHLRKIFVDPITGKAEWGVIYIGDKTGVLGVYSLSDAEPLKVANFDTRFTNLENKKKISDWKFMLPGQSGPIVVTGTGVGGPSLYPPKSPVQQGTPPAFAATAPPPMPPAPPAAPPSDATTRPDEAPATQVAPPVPEEKTEPPPPEEKEEKAEKAEDERKEAEKKDAEKKEGDVEPPKPIPR
ncbi:MAG: type II secretion system protein [Gammaproteobacteria bacterium]